MQAVMAAPLIPYLGIRQKDKIKVITNPTTDARAEIMKLPFDAKY